MDIPKPYNNYNIYFILERALLIEDRKDRILSAASAKRRPSSRATSPVAGPDIGYEFIKLPPLPPRYQHLESTLPHNWYMPGKNKNVKRMHKKTHGAVSFKEIAQIVADNWREIDPITKQYVDVVVDLLKRCYAEIPKTPSTGQKQKKSHGPKAAMLDMASPSSSSSTGVNQEVGLFASAPSISIGHDSISQGVHQNQRDIKSLVPITLEQVVWNNQQRSNSILYQEVDVSDEAIINSFLSS